LEGDAGGCAKARKGVMYQTDASIGFRSTVSRGGDCSQLAATCCVGYKTRPPWLKQSNREGLNVAAKSKTSVTSIKSNAKTAAPVKKKVASSPAKSASSRSSKVPTKAATSSKSTKVVAPARKATPAKAAVVKGKSAAGKVIAKPVKVQPKVTAGKSAAKPKVAIKSKATLPKVTTKTAGGKLSKPLERAPKKVAKVSPPAQSKKASSKPSTTATRVQKAVSKQSVKKPAIKSTAKGKVAATSSVAKKSSVLSIVKSATRAIAKVVSTAKRAQPQAAVVKPTPKVAAKALSMAPDSRSNLPTKSPKGTKKVPGAVAKAKRKSVESAVTAPAKPASKPTATVSKASPPAAKAPTPAEGLSNDTGNSMKSSGTRSTPSGKSSTTSTGGRAVGVKSAKPVAVQAPLTAVKVVRVDLPEGYRPARGEEYMNPFHLEYFRQKLLNWRAELVEESKQTIDNLREEVRDVGDEAERATRETENSLELRTRDRYRKLINKIEKAIKRIDEGEYGYCEETGEEIGLERLEARPIATLCLDAQERYEHRQKMMGD